MYFEKISIVLSRDYLFEFAVNDSQSHLSIRLIDLYEIENLRSHFLISILGISSATPCSNILVFFYFEIFRVQLAVCVSQIVKHDFPGRWPQVVDKVSIYLQNPEPSGITFKPRTFRHNLQVKSLKP